MRWVVLVLLLWSNSVLAETDRYWEARVRQPNGRITKLTIRAASLADAAEDIHVFYCEQQLGNWDCLVRGPWASRLPPPKDAPPSMALPAIFEDYDEEPARPVGSSDNR
jgi:hypothetical protein